MLRLSEMNLRMSLRRMGFLAALLCSPRLLLAQVPQPATPGTPPVDKKGREYTINVDVNLVVLHATVLDKKGRMVNDLRQDNFRVYEDGVLQ